MKVTVIGVAGGTGSGKSTLVKRLQEAFEGDDVVTLCHDYYYKAHPELTYEERTKLNYDHPQAFDTQMLVDHIKALKENVPIEHPAYTFQHDPLEITVGFQDSRLRGKTFHMRNAGKGFQMLQERIAHCNWSRFVRSIIIKVRDLDM